MSKVKESAWIMNVERVPPTWVHAQRQKQEKRNCSSLVLLLAPIGNAADTVHATSLSVLVE